MHLDLPNSPFSKPDYGQGFHPELSFVRILGYYRVLPSGGAVFLPLGRERMLLFLRLLLRSRVIFASTALLEEEKMA